MWENKICDLPAAVFFTEHTIPSYNYMEIQPSS